MRCDVHVSAIVNCECALVIESMSQVDDFLEADSSKLGRSYTSTVKLVFLAAGIPDNIVLVDFESK